MELIDEIHPIAKTPLYVVYPFLKPFRLCLGFLPQMQYEDARKDGEHEMSDLLKGQEAQHTVMINGKPVIKKKKATVKKQISKEATEQEPLA